MKTYYTLVSRDDENSPWGIEFGDYVRSVVKFEYDDYRDRNIKTKNLKIITSGDLQSEIDCAVRLLNEENTK